MSNTQNLTQSQINSYNQSVLNNQPSVDTPLFRTQQKREKYHNEIRQQQRQAIKRKIRKQQHQLLRSMGIITSNQSYSNQQTQQVNDQIFEDIQQQRDSNYVDYIMNQRSNTFVYYESTHTPQNTFNKNEKQDQCVMKNHHSKSQNTHAINYLNKTYEEIHHYRQKEFLKDPNIWWNEIRLFMVDCMNENGNGGNMGKRMESKLSFVEDVNVLHEVMSGLNQIMTLEMFYSPLEWLRFRCIQPEQFELILDWLVTVCAQLKHSNHQLPQQIKQDISTLVFLLICYQLKIQNLGYLGCQLRGSLLINNFDGNNSRQNKNGNNLWGRKVIFEILVEPFLWGHWFLITQSNLIELLIFSIWKICFLVQNQTDTISKDLLLDTNPIDDKLSNLGVLVAVWQQLICSLKSKLTFTKYNSPSNIKENTKNISNNSESSQIDIIQTLQRVCIVSYSTIAPINTMLSLLLVQQKNSNNHTKENNEQQFGKYNSDTKAFRVLTNRTVLIRSVIRLLITVDKVHQQIHSQSQNRNYDYQTDVKYQINQYLHTMKSHNSRLPLNHYVFKSSMIALLSNDYNKGNYKVRGNYQNGFESQFIYLKVVTITELLTLSQKSLHTGIFDKSTLYQNNQSYLLLKQQLSSVNLLQYMIRQLFETQSIRSPLFDQLTALSSVQQLTHHIIQTFNNNSKRQLTVYIVLMCCQLFTLFRKFNHFLFENKESICNEKSTRQDKKREKDDSKASIQVLLVNSLNLTIQTLNTIASQQEHNIWHHACLLNQLVTFNDGCHQSQQLNPPTLIEQCYEYLDYINNKMRHSKRSKKGFKIKEELSLFLQNIVYYHFPIQNHYSQFKNTSSMKQADTLLQLLNAYQQITKEDNQFTQWKQQQINYRSDQSDQIGIIQKIAKQRIQYLLSQHSLDTQTSKLLSTVQSLIEQSCIQTQYRAIKTVYLLLFLSDSQSSFSYFQSAIKSSTQIYNKIEYMAHNQEHSKIRHAAEEFLDQVDAGYVQQQPNSSNSNQKEI